MSKVLSNTLKRVTAAKKPQKEKYGLFLDTPKKPPKGGTHITGGVYSIKNPKNMKTFEGNVGDYYTEDDEDASYLQKGKAGFEKFIAKATKYWYHPGDVGGEEYTWVFLEQPSPLKPQVAGLDDMSVGTVHKIAGPNIVFVGAMGTDERQF